ncbi:unnamed protein product, partial [Owenia fusiformis]
ILKYHNGSESSIHIDENKVAYIKCSCEKKIQVEAASYQKKGDGNCTNVNSLTVEQRDLASKTIVENLCNNESSCSIKPNNNVFGEPCEGVHKQLVVNYKCHPPNGLSCSFRWSVLNHIEEEIIFAPAYIKTSTDILRGQWQIPTAGCESQTQHRPNYNVYCVNYTKITKATTLAPTTSAELTSDTTQPSTSSLATSTSLAETTQTPTINDTPVCTVISNTTPAVILHPLSESKHSEGTVYYVNGKRKLVFSPVEAEFAAVVGFPWLAVLIGWAVFIFLTDIRHFYISLKYAWRN